MMKPHRKQVTDKPYALDYSKTRVMALPYSPRLLRQFASLV